MSSNLDPEFIRSLDRTDRYVLVLHFYEDLTPAEVGLVLDLPEVTVRQRLADLRARIAALMQAHGSPQAA